MCVKLDASVLEFGVDLGLGQGQNTRLSLIVIGQPPNRQHTHSSSGKLLRIFHSSSLQHFPSGSLIFQPQGRILHLCVLTEHFMLPAGRGKPGKSQGGSCTASMGF